MTDVITSALTECEQVIERGLGSFVEVGNALMRIRDDELYREAGYGGFVEYLESKPWGIGRAQAYNMIETSAVSSTLEMSVPQRQARELAPLLKKATPAVVQQVYAEVVEETGGKPTAKKIREKVAEALPPKQQRNKHADFNRRIDEGVIPKLKSLNEAKLEAEDWHSYSRTTLRRHIKVMTTAQHQVEEWIAQAEKVLGTMPAK